MNPSERSFQACTRVLALVTDAFGGYGGIAQYNRDFLSALALTSANIRIDILPRLAPEKVHFTAPALVQHRAIFGRARYALDAVALSFRRKPAVVYSGHLYHNPLAQRIAKLTGAKLITQLHGTEIWGKIAPRQVRGLEASDLILTVSRDTRARTLEKIDIDPEKVVVISNTVGSDFSPGDRAAARAHFGISNELVILTVARLASREGYKGHDRIIPLLLQAQTQSRPILYLVAGVGDDLPRLQSLAKKHGVTSHVRFLGKIPGRDLPDLYRAADLFALPSTGEGFGIAYLEAMACGTPAIGLKVGGALDALGDGDLGLCVPEEDFVDAFTRALSAPRLPDQILSQAVHARFGLTAFQSRCREVMTLLN